MNLPGWGLGMGVENTVMQSFFFFFKFFIIQSKEIYNAMNVRSSTSLKLIVRLVYLASYVQGGRLLTGTKSKEVEERGRL